MLEQQVQRGEDREADRNDEQPVGRVGLAEDDAGSGQDIGALRAQSLDILAGKIFRIDPATRAWFQRPRCRSETSRRRWPTRHLRNPRMRCSISSIASSNG